MLEITVSILLKDIQLLCPNTNEIADQSGGNTFNPGEINHI